MAARPVEWVLVVFYGPAAHRATYGRKVLSKKYTKDYIQLSRRKKFLREVTTLFGLAGRKKGSVPLTYRWPLSSTTGAFVLKSADRPHLKWETALGAPQVWKMSPSPSETTEETIPGNPSYTKVSDAEGERVAVPKLGAGQPYLMAIKLQGESRTLHLRAYLSEPKKPYSWADIRVTPQQVQDLAKKTRQTSALASSTFASGGVPPDAKVDGLLARLVASSNPVSVIDSLDEESSRALADYLRNPGYGLFFDPTRNHDAWTQTAPLSRKAAESVEEWLNKLDERFPPVAPGDAAAEVLEADPVEVESFRDQIKDEKFGVPDATATVKTRGSAQRAFAEVVKANYRGRCAITDIATKAFLVAAHIVPWSKDQTIRLDPSNGICLSLLVDRAFENGCLVIKDDFTIHIDRDRIGSDSELLSQLEKYDGKKLTMPKKDEPKDVYLRRRRELTTPAE